MNLPHGTHTNPPAVDMTLFLMKELMSPVMNGLIAAKYLLLTRCRLLSTYATRNSKENYIGRKLTVTLERAWNFTAIKSLSLLVTDQATNPLRN